jgi:uncharacterized protein (TIRG00374 family)
VTGSSDPNDARPDDRAMASDTADEGPSDSMTASTSALNERATEPDDREISGEQLSIVRRLRQPRTIISLVLPIVLLLLFVRSLPGFKLEELPGKIAAANPLLLLAAFLSFYAGFPLRGLRWARLLAAIGYRIRTRDATEIIFVSWLINCLVPAKLGDIYRAYLLKLNASVSLSRTFGTVFIERILDLFAIVILGLAAGYVSFRNGLPPEVQAVFAVGLGVVVLLAIAMLTLRNFGRRILVALPVPHRVIEFYDRFEEGVFAAIGIRDLPILVLLTGLIWTTEALRLLFVVEALGLPGVHLGISGAFFVALTGSLLTAVPLTPAGIGVVETGVVAVLTLVYGMDQSNALTITLVDRAISVLSIIVFGSLAYAISPLRRGVGIRLSGSRSAPDAS